MSSYADKLKDPRWQRKRLEIFQRDSFTCQKCKATDQTLHAHHIKYDGDPWEADNDKIITLCHKCHKDEENVKSLISTTIISISEKTNVLITDYTELIIQVYEWSNRCNDKSYRIRFDEAIELIKRQDNG